jgi:rod shape determining protein RodA
MGIQLRKIDWFLVLVVVALAAIGLTTLYGIGRDPSFFNKQAVFAGLGLALMLIVARFDYRIFKNNSFLTLVVYCFSLGLLVYALMHESIRGSSGWILFGNFQFEPAELAKLGLIILLAKYFSQKHVEIYSFKHIIASGVYFGIPAVLIFKQPDIGSVAVLGLVWLAILFVSGVKRRHLFAIFMIVVVVGTFSWFVLLRPYQQSRLLNFLNPEADPYGGGFSVLQSKIAIGAGGLTGGEGTQTELGLVVEPYTDFTFSVFAERFGFAGVMILFGLLGLMFWRMIRIAQLAENNFAKLFSAGLLTMVFSHVLINGGMNLGVLPPTGIPFSFLSYGGSHFVVLMLGFGILQSIKVYE